MKILQYLTKEMELRTNNGGTKIALNSGNIGSLLSNKLEGEKRRKDSRHFLLKQYRHSQESL